MTDNHTAKTLMSYSKQELVDHCMALEKTNEALRQTFEIQYANCLKIVEDMKILNNTLEKVRRANG
jgi:hypothetical protein